MEQWDIMCCKCGKFILTEQKQDGTGNIKCVKGMTMDFMMELRINSTVKDVQKNIIRNDDFLVNRMEIIIKW